MADMEVDLHKGFEVDGWPRGPWKQTLHFDKTNKNQIIKLKTDCHGEETITARIEIKVRKS